MSPSMLLLCSLAVGQAPPATAGPAGSEPPLSAEAVAKGESDHLANIRQMTQEGETGEGYFAPDGGSVLFQSIRGDMPFFQIYLKDLTTGAERRVSTGRGRTTCAWMHPSGKSFIYASSHLDPKADELADAERKKREAARKNPQPRRSYEWAFDPHMEIFEADLQGTVLRRLTDSPGYDAECSFSPDGKEIVFCSFRRGNGDIYVMKADGTDVRQLTDNPGYDGGPFFSPDGRRIVYRAAGTDKPDYLQLHLMDRDGGHRRALTQNDDVNWGPFWHPDGRHIIYATSRHGHHNYELYLLDVDTGKEARVTYAMGADILPAFDADAKRLMWTSKRGKDRDGRVSSQLWMADFKLTK